MKAGQRAISKYELKIIIIGDWDKKGNQYDADDKDDDMNQLVKYARDKKKINWQVQSVACPFWENVKLMEWHHGCKITSQFWREVFSVNLWLHI